jgi:hypothetical protein
VDSSGSGQGSLAGCFEDGDERHLQKQRGKYGDNLSDYQPVKKGSLGWRKLEPKESAADSPQAEGQVGPVLTSSASRKVNYEIARISDGPV